MTRNVAHKGWTDAFWFPFGYLYSKINESYKVWMYITHVPYFRIQPDFSYSFETWRCLDRARGKGTNALKCDDMKGYLPMQPNHFHCWSQGLHWMLSTGCQSPYIHDFCTEVETNYYRTSHTWTIRVSSSRLPPLRRDTPESFRFPSLEGRSPPSTNVAKSSTNLSRQCDLWTLRPRLGLPFLSSKSSFHLRRSRRTWRTSKALPGLVPS